ncbi:MAG: radical SAM/SPASM domain-containing protein [Candidatus Nealsonbacteria bacterium]
MSNIKVNPNFHTIGGKSVLRSKNPRFLEYRKNWEERPKTFTAGEFPLHLDIEGTCLCNLKCSFCATNYEPIGGQGLMSFDTFKKIINEGSAHGLCAVKFNSGGRGEPLLNKDLPEMIAYAKKKGIMDIYFNTNAVLLTPETSKKLIESGLDRISISFEGTTAEVYEKYRAGASFEKVLKNIKDFVQLRNEMKKEKPLVRIQTVALPELVPVMDEYKHFWEKIADEIAFIDFKDYSHLNQDLIGDWACPYLWQRMMVRWDGTITICQFAYSDSYNLGNINQGDTIQAAWRGKAMEEIRELNKKGRAHQIKICNGCAFRTTEILKLKENV